ncbi:MAG: GerAB/ArcD/ProY family transporter, partial [Clostridia bacterium]
MKKDVITQLQLSSVIMLSVGLMNHVIIIPLLLNVAGRDSWFAVLVTTCLFLPYTTLLFYTMKRMQWQHPYAWLKQHYGKWAARIFGCLSGLVLFVMASLTMTDTVNWTRTSYFPQVPVIVLAVLLSCLCFYNSHMGIRSIALSSGIILPFVIVFGF